MYHLNTLSCFNVLKGFTKSVDHNFWYRITLSEIISAHEEIGAKPRMNYGFGIENSAKLSTLKADLEPACFEQDGKKQHKMLPSDRLEIWCWAGCSHDFFLTRSFCACFCEKRQGGSFFDTFFTQWRLKWMVFSMWSSVNSRMRFLQRACLWRSALAFLHSASKLRQGQALSARVKSFDHNREKLSQDVTSALVSDSGINVYGTISPSVWDCVEVFWPCDRKCYLEFVFFVTWSSEYSIKIGDKTWRRWCCQMKNCSIVSALLQGLHSSKNKNPVFSRALSIVQR